MKYAICTVLIWGVGANYAIFGMGYILHFTLVGGDRAHWFPILALAWALLLSPVLAWVNWLDAIRNRADD